MSKSEDVVQYFIVNKDLNMSKGKVAAQVSHVATLMTMDMFDPQSIKGQFSRMHLHTWLPDGKTVIVLKANEEQMQKLKDLEVTYHIIDEGRTEVPPDSLTVVGFPPMIKSEVQKIMQETCGKRLQLL